MEQKQKDEKLDDRQRQQICFYILRTLWLDIRGRKSRPTIYKVLGMSRPRFERIMQGRGSRVSEEELKKWSKLGFPAALMSGKRLFKISQLPEKEWLKWLKLCERNDDEAARKAWNGEKKRLNRYIHEARVNATSDEDIYIVSETIKSPDMKDASINTRLASLRVQMSSITLEQLLDEPIKELEDYIIFLDRQKLLALTARTVREELGIEKLELSRK